MISVQYVKGLEAANQKINVKTLKGSKSQTEAARGKRSLIWNYFILRVGRRPWRLSQRLAACVKQNKGLKRK